MRTREGSLMPVVGYATLTRQKEGGAAGAAGAAAFSTATLNRKRKSVIAGMKHGSSIYGSSQHLNMIANGGTEDAESQNATYESMPRQSNGLHTLPRPARYSTDLPSTLNSAPKQQPQRQFSLTVPQSNFSADATLPRAYRSKA